MRVCSCILLQRASCDFVMRRLRVASPQKISKQVQNRGCALAYYSQAARPSAMSFCVRAPQNSAKQPRTRRERVCSCILLQRASCDFVLRRLRATIFKKAATRAGDLLPPCCSRSCVRPRLTCVAGSPLGPLLSMVVSAWSVGSMVSTPRRPPGGRRFGARAVFLFLF